jgi:CheY-like chemotaxis protein
MSHTLLLADDSVTIQRVIELTFADEDIRVVAVGDGQQALDRIAAEPPDIVLADTGMPERDGYDVATYIKRDASLRHIPVVLLTGAFEPVDGDRAREAGCDAVLVKPFEPQLVISRVKELLGASLAAPTPSAAASEEAESEPPSQAALPASSPEPNPPEVSLPSEIRFVDSPAEVDAIGDEGAVSTDDPLGDYLDRMDDAFDRLQADETIEEPAKSPEPASGDEAVAEIDSLEGALSALEGALKTLSFEDEQQGELASAAPAASPSPDDPATAAELSDLDADVRAPATSEPVPTELESVVEPVPLVPASVDVPSDGRVAPPSLADAFSALLAAERGGTGTSAAAAAWSGVSSPADDDAFIDRVTERVIDRLSDSVTNDLVAQVVALVAEKLVREERDRIK